VGSWFALEPRENQVYFGGGSTLFYLALAGRLLIALNTKCPRWRIARGESSHQVTVNLVLAYLAQIRLTIGRCELVFVLRHSPGRNALTVLLWE
jgi:hypothetical protein